MPIDRKHFRKPAQAGPEMGDTALPISPRGASVARDLDTWRTHYATLWTIAGAATVEELERLYDDGFRKARREFKRRAQPYRRSPYKGRRLQSTVEGDELNEALDSLRLRVRDNRVFLPTCAIAIEVGESILNLISEVRVYLNPD